MTLKFIKKFARDEDGATAIEYGLFAALIAAVIVVTVGLLGGNVHSGFTAVNTALEAALTAGGEG
jgi:pilus assembly protein Flp/PilA